MATHTPGPWKVDPKYPLTIRPTVPTDHILPDGTPQRHAAFSNVEVADLAQPLCYGNHAHAVAVTRAYYDRAREHIIPPDAALANARLMAAAPQMLADHAFCLMRSGLHSVEEVAAILVDRYGVTEESARDAAVENRCC